MLLLVLNHHDVPAAQAYAFRKSMTMGVLYGIFPVVLLGMAISHYAYKWACKPLEVYEKARQAAARGELQVESGAVMKKIYRCVELFRIRIISCHHDASFMAQDVSIPRQSYC